jgi:hypothetical protein
MPCEMREANEFSTVSLQGTRISGINSVGFDCLQADSRTEAILKM